MGAFEAISDTSVTTPAMQLLGVLERLGIGNPSVSRETQAQGLEGLMTGGEIQHFLDRDRVRQTLQRRVEEAGRLNLAAVAAECSVSRELVGRVWQALCDDYPPVQPAAGSLTIGIPKETRARDMVVETLAAGGFRLQGGSIVDIQNGLDPIRVVATFRQQDLLTVMKAGRVQAVIMGSDKAEEVLARQVIKGSPVAKLERLARLQANAFRLCLAFPADVVNADGFSLVEALQGARIATSYPNTARRLLEEWGTAAAEILHMGGNVEAAPAQLGATAILDIIQTGGSLGRNRLVPVFEIPCGMDLLSLGERPVPCPQRLLLERFTARLQKGERLLAG